MTDMKEKKEMLADLTSDDITIERARVLLELNQDALRGDMGDAFDENREELELLCVWLIRNTVDATKAALGEAAFRATLLALQVANAQGLDEIHAKRVAARAAAAELGPLDIRVVPGNRGTRSGRNKDGG